MTEKYLQFLQPHVRAIKLVNGQPYALMQNEQRGYVFNLETKQKLQVTSNAFTFNATATGIYFFKFPNRVLALINPITSYITMLRARPSDHRNDLIFVSGNKPYILLHQQPSVVFPNNENVYYCPAVGLSAIAPDLRDALIVRSWVFCSNVVIKYDKTLSVFEYYACSKDAKVYAALDRLRLAGRIYDDFYDNGTLLVTELHILLSAYETAGEPAASAAAQIDGPFSSVFEEYILYKGTVFEIFSYERTVCASGANLKTQNSSAKEKTSETQSVYQRSKSKTYSSGVGVSQIQWSEISDIVVYAAGGKAGCYERVRVAQQVAKIWTFDCDEKIVYSAARMEYRQAIFSLSTGETMQQDEHLVDKNTAIAHDRIVRFESLHLHELLKRCEKEFVDTGDAANWLFSQIVLEMKASK